MVGRWEGRDERGWWEVRGWWGGERGWWGGGRRDERGR